MAGNFTSFISLSLFCAFIIYLYYKKIIWRWRDFFPLSFSTLKRRLFIDIQFRKGKKKYLEQKISPLNSFEQNVLSCQVLREQPLAASRDRGYFSSQLRSVSTPGPEFHRTRSLRTVWNKKYCKRTYTVNKTQCAVPADQSHGTQRSKKDNRAAIFVQLSF